MPKAIVIGDGPAGLSAALFLAKNGIETAVFGPDTTAMHYALLYNYLGIPEITGTEFQKIARQQVAHFGAELQDKEVTSVEKHGKGFMITTSDGARHESDYVVIAEGKAAKLAKAIGLEMDEQGVVVDHRSYRTGVEGLYVVGRATTANRSQAIISAGQGATAAIDILSEVMGRDVRDFDEPPKEG